MDDPKKTSSFASYLTPARSIRRAFDSIEKTKLQLRSTAREMGKLLPGQAANQQFEEGDLRNITDARQRYQAMYALHEWTPEGIAKQLKTLRITKLTAYITAIISLTLVIALAIQAPIWMAIVLIPVSGSALVLGIAQGFKYALYEAQINLEEFISAREFVAREDFWRKLLG